MLYSRPPKKPNDIEITIRRPLRRAARGEPGSAGHRGFVVRPAGTPRQCHRRPDGGVPGERGSVGQGDLVTGEGRRRRDLQVGGRNNFV